MRTLAAPLKNLIPPLHINDPMSPKNATSRRISFSRATALFALFALAACAMVPEREPPPDIDMLLAALKEHMYTYISEERQKLNPDAILLRPDPLLAAAAQEHSEAMAERGAFDVGGGNDNIAIQRLAADATFQGFVGENSAMQFFYPTFGFDPEMFARGFVDQWLESESHRANIEYTSFALTGIGVAANGNEIYAAGLFATELDPSSEAE